jgi:hypothetical protein
MTIDLTNHSLIINLWIPLDCFAPQERGLTKCLGLDLGGYLWLLLPLRGQDD